MLHAITLRDNRSGKERSVETSWLFLCLGGLPHTQWAEEVGMLRDQAGYLVTGPDLFRNGQHPANWPLNRDPYYLDTNIPGMVAAGDVRHGSVKRFASAVGEGRDGGDLRASLSDARLAPGRGRRSAGGAVTRSLLC